MSAAPLAVATVAGLDAHRVAEGHPERPARLDAAVAGVGDGCPHVLQRRVDPVPAPAADLLRVHDARHLARVEAACAQGARSLDPDTSISHGSWPTALLAAGAGLAVIDAIERGEARRGFVVARPPGHHATATRAMGFCLLNNVAVAAAALRDRGERVAIVDWDVHHGNGTQDIFWDDPSVLFASIHQAPPAYPQTGAVDETGGASAAGATINVPLPAGATGDAFRRALDDVIGPAIDAFSPTWLLISAGFDAHRADPLAELQLTSADYGDLAQTLLSLLPRARGVVAFLEGGYHLDALRHSTAVTAAVLAGVDPPAAEARSSGGPGADAVAAARRAHVRAVDASA